MSAETIKSFLTIKPGKSFDNSDIDDSVKALFGTGLFGDVSISRSGSTLVVEVSENATINEVFIEGNKRIKDPALLASIQSRPRGVFSPDSVASDVDRIQGAYDRVGRGDAVITSEVVPLANNRVNIVFQINEGDKTKIASITFIGNDNFREARLREVMTTKRTNFLSWLRTDDVYDPARLSSDEERLRRFYFDKGYADFQIVSSSAILDEANNSYNITLTIDEGAKYTFGDITIESTINGVDVNSLYSKVETKTGKSYSASAVEETIIGMTESVAGDGFAFVEVIPRGDRNFETNTINITYLVDKGSKVYIERISIIGNDRTRDHVIRREFDISEGDPLNQVFIQRAKKRLDALGIFESVNITTRAGSAADKVVLIVTVVDKPTGEFSIGGGYSSEDSASGNVSFTERNFLGRGQYLKISGSGGADSRSYQLSFTEPYFLGYRVSAGFDIGASSKEATDSQQFATESTFGSIRFGIPITDRLKSSVFYSYNSTSTSVDVSKLDTVGTQGDATGELSAALLPTGYPDNRDWTKSGIGYSLVYNSVDSRTTPREGVNIKLNQVAYGAGGDASYLTTTTSAVAYMPLIEDYDVIGMIRGRAGANIMLGDDDGYRTLDNFRQGGSAIRGFSNSGFGPRDPFTDDALGGMYYWNATAEINTPAPFLPESAGFRTALFVDAGALWGVDDVGRAAIAAIPGADMTMVDDDSIRASYGASIIWNSPFGPLRFDYAEPIQSKSYDKIRQFNFGISSSF